MVLLSVALLWWRNGSALDLCWQAASFRRYQLTLSLLQGNTACGSTLWFPNNSTTELLTYASQTFPIPSPNPCFVLAPLLHIRICVPKAARTAFQNNNQRTTLERVNLIILKCLFGGPINYWEQSSHTFCTRPTYSLARGGSRPRFNTGRSVSVTLATKVAFPNCGR